MRRTPALLAAAVLALAACDWPVPDRGDPAATGPWPALLPDAALGLGGAAPVAAEATDLAAREAALRARAAALNDAAGIDADTAARLDAAGG